MNVQLLLYGVLLTFVVFAALAVAFLRDILSAIIAFAGFSFGVAIVYILLRAPDVALTEAAVGAGVTTVLFLLAIVRTVRPGGDRLFERVAWGPAIIATGLVGVLLTTVRSLPTIGDPNSPVATSEITRYYLENAYPQTEVENVVTAILAAYRGFDTLGEAAVVLAAGLAVLVVLRKEVYV
ncbi:cation:proton antiporter [Haloferax sp. Atlit-12N]|nr:cation:proton antiporter [Haloferax sp. Atlit-12N]